MPKQATALPLSLPAARGGTPLYRWFYEELRSAILEGRLKPAARLPATRDLAHQYGLSRSTVVAAFEQLKSAGYVEGKIGAGNYVSEVIPYELLQVGRIKRRLMLFPSRCGRRSRRGGCAARRRNCWPEATLWATDRCVTRLLSI